MPSLKDLAALTGELDGLTTELHAELTQGAIDFRKMVDIADNVGAISDRLAAGFSTMADALETSLDGGRERDAGEEEQDEE